MATHDVKNLSYQVFNHGGIIESKILSIPSSRKFEVEISPTRAMAPKSKIIFYYVTSDGEIISDKVSLEFENKLPNNVRIQEFNFKSNKTVNFKLFTLDRHSAFIQSNEARK